MGIARFTCGGSPSRSDAIPISSPRSFTTALPPHCGLAGATMIAGSTRRTNEGRDETSPGLSRRAGAEVGAPGATVGASRSVAKANITTRFMEPLQFRGAPRPAGPQPRDGLQRAPHFRGAPRPAGPQPRDGLQRAPPGSAMPVLSLVVGAELPGLERPPPRFVLTIP